MSYQDGLKLNQITLDPTAALRAPVEILLGINSSVRDALLALGLQSVLDLATSPLFRLACEVGEASYGKGTATLGGIDAVPGGSVNAGGPIRLADLAAADLSVLRGLTLEQANAIKSALQVDSVGDLGRWLPYKAARAILTAAIGVGGIVAAEDEARELVPKMGEFPTERRYYSTIVMDQVSVSDPLALVGAGPVDITPAVAADFGFSAPAVGARLTFQQSWYAHGVTLGNLLHSVALAPGESTRIAVIDWSRRTSAFGTESIGETEALTNETAHNRAVSEVQEAVAHEMQSGFSHTDSTATTEEVGGGLGFSLGPFSLGGSASSATTTTSAGSFSTSAGSRELAASMSQQVMDATQQAASSVRNRRASIVKEVSEEEHESVSTRILANYNHMYALNLQYYEVVEVYRVLVELNQVERCVFVPMKLVDFNDRIVGRFQAALARSALNRRVRELLTIEYGMIRVSPTLNMSPFVGAFAEIAAIPVAPTAPTDTDVPPMPPRGSNRLQGRAVGGGTAAASFQWDVEEIRRASRITASNVVRPGRSDVFLPRDAVLEGVSFVADSGPALTAISIRRQHGAPEIALIGGRMPTPVPLQEILEVVVAAAEGTSPIAGGITLNLSYHGAFFPVTFPIKVEPNISSAVLRVSDAEAGPELVEHLQANRLHYNQAIWRSMDTSTVALLLSRFSFENQPLADLIDPRPIQTAGNYLVFRMPGYVSRPSLLGGAVVEEVASAEERARRDWSQWLVKRGLTFGRESVTEQLVPVPTGGVFAEAVLGRSNAAEKLDMTRFWNWQDSPIPLQPPEIAAINMASRTQPVDATPGQLGQPVLNIVNPTNLPAPTDLSSMLGALQNGNMFRDMAGLAATIGLAQESGSNATSASANAGRLAAANLAVAAQKEIEKERIAAQLAMGVVANPATMGGSPGNISEMGALYNSAGARDRERASGGPGAAGANTNSGTNSNPASGPNGTDIMPGIPDSMRNPLSSRMNNRSFQNDALSRAIWGAWGVPASNLLLAGAPVNGPDFNVQMDDAHLMEWLHTALDGAHVIGSVGEIITVFHSSAAWPAIEAGLSTTTAVRLGGFMFALEVGTALGYVAVMVVVVLELHHAFTTGTRIERKTGFCFGIMWSALGMEDLPKSLEAWATDSEEELRDAWNEGVKAGREKFRDDKKLHNQVLLRLAYEHLTQHWHKWTDPAARVLNLLWAQVRGEDLPDTHLYWYPGDLMGKHYTPRFPDDLITESDPEPAP